MLTFRQRAIPTETKAFKIYKHVHGEISLKYICIYIAFKRMSIMTQKMTHFFKKIACGAN